MKRRWAAASAGVIVGTKGVQNGHQGYRSSTVNMYPICCDQLLSNKWLQWRSYKLTNTHAVNKRIMCTQTHVHIMDTLFIALSALVSCFCVSWSCLLMTGFMDYGKSSSTVGMLIVDCGCKWFPVLFKVDLALAFSFYVIQRTEKAAKVRGLWFRDSSSHLRSLIYGFWNKILFL